MFSRNDRSRSAIEARWTFAGMFGIVGISACLLATGCSGGEKVSSTPVEGNDAGLVEIPAAGEEKSSGPAVNAMTPGGKGPGAAAGTP